MITHSWKIVDMMLIKKVFFLWKCRQTYKLTVTVNRWHAHWRLCLGRFNFFKIIGLSPYKKSIFREKRILTADEPFLKHLINWLIKKKWELIFKYLQNILMCRFLLHSSSCFPKSKGVGWWELNWNKNFNMSYHNYGNSRDLLRIISKCCVACCY